MSLIRDVEAGKLAGIVVARLDRFARTLIGGVEALEAIRKVRGFVQTVEGGIDTSTAGGAMGELQLNLLLMLAQWERTTRAEGFEVAKQRAVARGVHIAGTVPVGYLRSERGGRLELDPAKAPAIRDAFELRATGASFGEVARLLDGTLPGGPSGGGVWNRRTVTRLLENRVHLGEARQGEHRTQGAHLSIVATETFDMVQALGRRKEPSAPGVALLDEFLSLRRAPSRSPRRSVRVVQLQVPAQGRRAPGDWSGRGRGRGGRWPGRTS